MVSPFRLSRRAVLRGAAGVAVALPWLEAMTRGTAHAQAAPPRRFVTFFTSCGTIRSEWARAGSSATDFTFGRILEPLTPHRGDLIVPANVTMESARNNPGNGHCVGITNMLVARPFLRDMALENGFGAMGWGAGVSLDQHVASRVGRATRLSSLELGVSIDAYYRGSPYAAISYAGPRMPLPTSEDPRAVFTRLFGAAGVDPSALRTAREQRRSVLDFVAGDYARLTARLGSEDRARVDAHATALRELERRLDAPGLVGASCAAPTVTATTSSDMPAKMRAMTDLAVMAMACDLTRVVTLQNTAAQPGTRFPWLSINDSHHGLSHATDSDAVARDKIVRLNRWYAEQFAYLLAAMKRVPEGAGTMLDNSVVLWVNEIAVGNTHAFTNMPWLIAGRAGGSLRTGRMVDCANRPHGELFVSLLNAMGLPDATFGDPRWCRGPIPGLAG